MTTRREMDLAVFRGEPLPHVFFQPRFEPWFAWHEMFGIPAVLFLDHHSREELAECTERVVQMFHPRLVLGIGDELPEAGGAEAFERLRWVADYARTHSA